jgi:hypothetical protein|tara:strand:- start:1106 stop:2080 length:975 start_codon:yes stop_codon:yes gene_type:complete
MAQMQNEEFKFPDEVEDQDQNPENQIEVEIIDDTPEEDRKNLTPMPKEIVQQLDDDDLEKFAGEAKEKLLQMKKVYNDERRRADAAEAEQAEAIRIATAIIEENKKLKSKLTVGEQNLVTNVKQNINHELLAAKQAYKDAYDSGDSDRLVDAQEKLTEVKLKAQQIEQYRPEFSEEALQSEENAVKIPQQPQRLDSKTQSWLDKNKWYGVDDDMSYLAHGVHRRLEREGVPIGSDQYWATIDSEVKKRFPEKFGQTEEIKPSSEAEIKPSAKSNRPATVVAPATRSTSPKRITLTLRQQALAKKLNLTNEQYANELNKLESQNG